MAKPVSYVEHGTGVVLVGDCLARLQDIDDETIDSIVTDPPYEICFMGRAWDSTGIAYNVELWRECLRVLKPGGHVLAFGATRSYHRMAVAIEDAGFEIRDSIHWTYGSGFPKSLDVSKAIDKAAGAERTVVGQGTSGKTAIWNAQGGMGTFAITSPATPDAARWQGWGTALKPSHEPIVVARKPLTGTVAVNVLAYGTGALNIDGCRVGVREDSCAQANGQHSNEVWEQHESRDTSLAYPAEQNAAHAALDHCQCSATKTAEQTTNAQPQTRQEATSQSLATACSGGTSEDATNTSLNTGGFGNSTTAPYQQAASSTTLMKTNSTTTSETYNSSHAESTQSYTPESQMCIQCGGLLPNTSANTDGVVEMSTSASTQSKNASAEPSGRWPSNSVLTHAADCQQQEAGSTVSTPPEEVSGGIWQESTGKPAGPTYTDVAARWDCVEHCPVYQLDQQQDGASRFFTQTEWDPTWDAPFIYQAKPSKKERDAGLDNISEKQWVQWQTGNGASGKASSMSAGRNTTRRNTHPTVKPVALMRTLCRLVTPPGGVVLDPFLGSGTTAVAAVLEGFGWVGCEMTPEYLPIIKGRVQHAEKEAAKAQQLTLDE